MAEQTSHCWSKDALLTKSQRFFEEMLQRTHDEWQFAHWSTLALELLARAALANISPVLLADEKSWHNIHYALGHAPKAPKFVPSSIAITAVFSRLREILPDFTTDMEGFGIVHMSRRNDELHSGDTPFDGLDTSKWLAPFYEACTVLARSLGVGLDMLVGKAEAEVAEAMIAASHDESAKAVMKSVAAHKTVWAGKNADEREQLTTQAAVWATRQSGHRVKCPSCDCDSLLHGVPIAEPNRAIDGEDIVETQQYLPSRFECVACGLKISTLAQLQACGLGNPYKSTSTYSAAEYYSSNDEYAEYEDDNNEY